MTATVRRDMRLVATLRGVSFFGDLAAVIALSLRISSSGAPNSRLLVAALFVANAIPPVALAPVSGLVVDRVRAKALLVPICLAQGVVAVALGLTTSSAATIALVAALGCGVAFTQPGYTALLPALVGADNLARAQGLMTASLGLATVFGPAVGGLLSQGLGTRWPLYVDAMTFAACGLGTLALTGDRVPGPSERRQRGEMTAGLRHLFSDAVLRPVTIAAIVFVFAFALISGVTQVYLITRSLHASKGAYGVLTGVLGVGTVVGALWAGRRESRPIAQVKVFLVGLAILGAGFIGVGLSPNAWVAGVPMVIAGFGDGIVTTSVTVLFALRTRDEIRGRVFAAVNAIIISCEVTSYAVAGVLLIYLSPRVIAVAGGAVAVGTILALGPGTLRAARPALNAGEAQGA